MLFQIVYNRKTGEIICTYREADIRTGKFLRISRDTLLHEIEQYFLSTSDAEVLVTYAESSAELLDKRVDTERKCLVAANPTLQ
jgi:hypothetical protein